MTREEAIKKWIIPAIERTWNEKKCKEIIEALEQEHCDDAISRQAAIEAIDALYLEGDSCVSFRASADGDALIGKYQAITALDDLPPVTPHKKMGRWIYAYITADGHRMYQCSECGWFLRKKNGESFKSLKWCCSCGAKMQGVEE